MPPHTKSNAISAAIAAAIWLMVTFLLREFYSTTVILLGAVACAVVTFAISFTISTIVRRWKARAASTDQ